MPNPPPGFEWDEPKAAWNLRAHGISFAAAALFEFESALELEGNHDEENEIRSVLLGKVGRQVCVIVITRRSRNIRVISLRRASAEERRFYIEAKNY